jgi:hypothetical protein
MIKLSQTSKMPCKSWSLPALSTCPGSRTSKGELVEVCQGCYATTGFYKMGAAQALRNHNRFDWERPAWIANMIEAIKDDAYFRWFDSGDVFSSRLAEKMLKVMKYTPNTQHWVPTRSHKVMKIKQYLSMMKRMPNASVRYSSDRVNRFNKRLHGSVVSSKPLDNTFECKAYTRGGQCGDCRACWDKTIKTIAYPAHGYGMKRIAANA